MPPYCFVLLLNNGDETSSDVVANGSRTKKPKWHTGNHMVEFTRKVNSFDATKKNRATYHTLPKYIHQTYDIVPMYMHTHSS